MSVAGISTCLTSGGIGGSVIGATGGLGGSGAALSCVLGVLTPGGGLRSLGGTTSGVYEGTSACGTSNIGTGSCNGSGMVMCGKTKGSPKSIT